jgi:hypothetical protein
VAGVQARIRRAVKADYGTASYHAAALEAGERLRKVMLRRRRTEVLPDLPTKTHRISAQRSIDVTRQLADEVWAEMKRAGRRGISLEDALENSKLPVVFELMSKVRAALATAKIPAMLEAVEAEIEETGEPQLVFSAHRAPIDLLEDRRPGWAVITGDTSPDARSRRRA